MTTPAAPRAKRPSLNAAALSGILWNALSSVAQLVLRLAMLAVLARLIAPADFGVIAVVLMLLGAAAVFSQVFIGPALIQRQQVTPALLHSAFTLSVGLGLLIAGALLAGGQIIEDLFQIAGLREISRAAALVFFLQALDTVPEAILARRLHFKRMAKTDIVSYVFGYAAVALPCAVAGLGVWSLVAGMAVQAVMRWAALTWITRADFGFGWDGACVRELLRAGSGFSLSRISNMLATRGDNFIVGRFLGAEALGLYERAYTVMKMPATLYGNVADKVAFAALSRAQDDAERAQRGFMRATQLTALFGMTLSVLLAILSGPLVLVLLGPAWTGMILPFQLLAFSMYPRVGYKLAVSNIVATGGIRQANFSQLVYAAMILGGSWFAVDYGLAGVSAVVAVVIWVHFLLLNFIAAHKAGVKFRRFLALHLAPLASASLVAAVVYPVSVLLEDRLPAFGTLALGGLAGGGVFVAAGLLKPRWFWGDEGAWLALNLRSRVQQRFAPRRAGIA